jgi:hypothetical protein
MRLQWSAGDVVVPFDADDLSALHRSVGAVAAARFDGRIKRGTPLALAVVAGRRQGRSGLVTLARGVSSDLAALRQRIEADGGTWLRLAADAVRREEVGVKS